jgi:NTE family protein
MNDHTSSHARDTRAVVLGGGGVTGIAWEVGVLAGLLDEGIDLAEADAIIGTSAGSFAGAYLAAGSGLEDLYAGQFSVETTEIPATMSPESIKRYTDAITEGAGDARRIGAALGRMALAAETISSEARAEVVARRLPSHEWPRGPLMMTAIDAESGELHVFDKTSGLPLTTAAAASGAVPGLWPVVSAVGRRWIDGGSCSPTNAGLAAQHGRVVVIAPVITTFPGLPAVVDEVEALRPRSQAVLLSPDERTEEAIGGNVFDPARRGPAAEAGRLQGRAAAAEVRRVWG